MWLLLNLNDILSFPFYLSPNNIQCCRALSPSYKCSSFGFHKAHFPLPVFFLSGHISSVSFIRASFSLHLWNYITPGNCFLALFPSHAIMFFLVGLIYFHSFNTPFPIYPSICSSIHPSIQSLIHLLNYSFDIFTFIFTDASNEHAYKWSHYFYSLIPNLPLLFCFLINKWYIVHQ